VTESYRNQHTGGSESSVAICPVRRQCPRFRATGYTMCRAVHDQGPRGYPVSEVEPMTLRSVIVSTDGPFTHSLLAFTVTLSLGRPHGSCGHARPEAPAGTKHFPPHGDFNSASLYPHKLKKRKGEKKRGRKTGMTEEEGEEGRRQYWHCCLKW